MEDKNANINLRNSQEKHEDDPGVSSDEENDTGGTKKGRRKIKIEFIEDKSRRHITFSKRKAGIMKKAYELATLTGTQVLLLVASETGHVYTFATPKLQPLITKPEGKNLIQSCLNAPDVSQTTLPRSDSSSYDGFPAPSPMASQDYQQASPTTEDDDKKPKRKTRGRDKLSSGPVTPPSEPIAPGSPAQQSAAQVVASMSSAQHQQFQPHLQQQAQQQPQLMAQHAVYPQLAVSGGVYMQPTMLPSNVRVAAQYPYAQQAFTSISVPPVSFLYSRSGQPGLIPIIPHSHLSTQHDPQPNGEADAAAVAHLTVAPHTQDHEEH